MTQLPACRIVSPQTPKEIEEKVRSYLENEFRNLGTRNKLEVVMTDGGMPWVDDYKHYNYQAAQAATEVSSLHKKRHFDIDSNHRPPTGKPPTWFVRAVLSP